ncbi:MAG: hypothetical protein JW837_11775 [Sedimentisphaerales bacterium]|nr:hypothetical protein [Sedimentisphaerales bacterium]
MATQKSKINNNGVALLVVLFIVMVITICSIGFLSRSNVELATGRNMTLRIQMDYLAESGLEHARGLILNPQDIDIDSGYWTATGQQLASGDDYYDITVVRDSADRCNYIIDCNSYRLRNSEKIGRSSLKAELRLDPCIAFWSGSDTTIWGGFTINGDVYCNGTLTNNGSIDGDVFTNTLNGSITGKQKTIGDLTLAWPEITVEDFTSHYTTEPIDNILINTTRGSYDPVRVCYREGDLLLAGNVQIKGMLLVKGNLTVQGTANIITAAKNLPAILVTGNISIEANSALNINGLAVVDGTAQVSADSANVNILGGLFVNGSITETTEDSSSMGNTGTLYNGPTWQPSGGHINGTLEFNGNNTAVEVGTSGMNPLQGTISLWAYAINFPGNAPLHNYLFGHVSTSVWTDRIQLYMFEGENRLFLGLGDTHHKHADIQMLDTHRWYHIALTWDGTDYVVYVDGIEKANGSYSGLSTLGSIADIGNNGKTTDRKESFSGFIDDVQIYNRVLDPNDIPPPADGLPGLVGHWKLDESGSSISITAAPLKTAIILWSETAEEQKWGQAAGAFFKSIQRQ